LDHHNRWCRYAQPPATLGDASGIEEIGNIALDYGQSQFTIKWTNYHYIGIAILPPIQARQ
jgi:hypothetical protein